MFILGGSFSFTTASSFHFTVTIYIPKSLSIVVADFWGSSPGGISGKEPACQCRRHKRHRYDPWDGRIPWRRAWQPTPVFMTGEFHGQRSLAGYSPQGLTELDVTEAISHARRERRKLKQEIRDQQEQNTHRQYIHKLKGGNSDVFCLESLGQITLRWEPRGEGHSR